MFCLSDYLAFCCRSTHLVNASCCLIISCNASEAGEYVVKVASASLFIRRVGSKIILSAAKISRCKYKSELVSFSSSTNKNLYAQT